MFSRGTVFHRSPSKIAHERVMIEYSQPKYPQRISCRSFAQCRTWRQPCAESYKYNGYDVIGVNYIGDVGAHIAKCLWFYPESQY